MSRCVRVLISGHVQGVGYRMWCFRRATVLGLEGWARNLGKGAVEAVFAGEPQAIADMLEACWTGPPMAHVEAVSVTDTDRDVLDLRGSQNRFVILMNG